MSSIDIQHPVFRRFYSHLNSAVTILQLYDGSMPFAHFLKNYFTQHKKFGSKDRKQVANLCYSYFRLGRSYRDLNTEQKIIKGYWLSATDWTDEWLAFFSSFDLPAAPPDQLFPFTDYLSAEIDKDAFTHSHLIQPDLFLRIRPGYTKPVTEKLKAADIPFDLTDDSLRLNNSGRIEDVIRLNREAVVQDLSSQKVARLLQLYKTINSSEGIPVVWDCCAASGGKSILATDVLQTMKLTVSDIRPSIIFNLKKRFQEAQIKNYESFVADTSGANPGKLFDLIIADVPCSGSGTWARTPEQLLFFEPASIDDFAKLQSAIVTNAIRYLKPGGYLLYITCSVFSRENEEQVRYLQQEGLQLKEQCFFKGYEQKADTMFAALMRASSQ